MSRTHILSFTKLEDAQQAAADFSDYDLLLIGPTDQVALAREKEDGLLWRSGNEADFFLLIATTAKIRGPGD